MSRQTNYMIVNGVMLPISGAMPLSDLEMPLRILGVIVFAVLMGAAAFVLWNLPAVSV